MNSLLEEGTDAQFINSLKNCLEKRCTSEDKTSSQNNYYSTTPAGKGKCEACAGCATTMPGAASLVGYPVSLLPRLKEEEDLHR